MSQENVEIVRRMYEAFHSGDADRALAHFDPDVVVDASKARPDGGKGQGHEQLNAIVNAWMGTWEEWREEIADIRDLGSQVLVLSVQYGRGKGSGEWHVSFRLPDLPLDKAVYHGHDEVRRLWAAFRSGWAKLTVTLEEVIDAREDFVVVRTRFVGRGSASGIEVDRTVFYVFEIVAGKLKRLRPFDTEAEALEAAGLEQ
jgi:ketosteroid isomerase-like protein